MEYLSSAKRQFDYYKLLAEKSIAQIDDASFFLQPNQNTNSIAIIVHHLWGNMMSRWTDFRTTDGEKTWRNRDAEFEPVQYSKEELMKKWEEGWACLFAALDSVNDNQLSAIINIRNEGHTILEAINRQIAHYCYHVGQIVSLAKQYSSDFQALSIPKNKSSEYNNQKFEQEKSTRHFTDEWLNKKEE